MSSVRGVARSTRRGAAESAAEYMAASEEISSVESAGAAALGGVRRATTEAAARRGEMELAISSGVVPEGTCRMEPSGRVMEMTCALMGGILAGLRCGRGGE